MLLLTTVHYALWVQTKLGMVDLNVLLENTTVQGGTFNVTSATDADGADILGGDVQQNSTILTYDTDGNLPFTINVCYEFGCPDWDTDNDGDVDIFDFDLDSEDVNQNGVCDPGEDVNGNGVLDGIIDDTEALAILNSECGYALAAGIIPDANNDGVVDDEDLETLYPNTNGYMVQITTANIDTQSFSCSWNLYYIPARWCNISSTWLPRSLRRPMWRKRIRVH